MHSPLTTSYAAHLDRAIAEPKHVRETPKWQDRYLNLWLDFIGHDPEGCAAYLKELDAEEAAP